jgi:hypothetical protein
MEEEKLVDLARELGLCYSKESIGIMLRLLDGGLPAPNLVKIIEEIEAERDQCRD